MQSNIAIGAFKPIKPHSLTWKRSLDNYSDTATIKVPGMARLRCSDNQYTAVNAAEVFQEGMAVKAYAGYNGVQQLRFQGFIRRINFTIPVQIECEGYSYLLRKKEGYTNSYKNTTAKQILSDLIAGTVIKLSGDIPDIPLQNIYFKNVKGTDVLDYLKDKCLLTIYFNNEVLYCGLKMTEVKKTVKLRLGWNVIKDDELKFEAGKELATVNIQIEKRNPDGSKIKAKHGQKDGSVKILKVRHITDEASLATIAAEERKKLVYRGYEGMITCFATPVIEPGMAVNIYDSRYPQRTGQYFVEAVDGSFTTGGGRQKIKIGAAV